MISDKRIKAYQERVKAREIQNKKNPNEKFYLEEIKELKRYWNIANAHAFLDLDTPVEDREVPSEEIDFSQEEQENTPNESKRSFPLPQIQEEPESSPPKARENDEQEDSILEKKSTEEQRVLFESLKQQLSQFPTSLKRINRILLGMFLSLIVLTVILFIFSSFLDFDQYVSHIQAWHKSPNRWTHFFFNSRMPKVYYYFITDLLWGPLVAFFLYFVHKWFFQWNELQKALRSQNIAERGKPLGNYFLSAGFLKIILGIAVVAAIMDILEFPLNIWDLNCYETNGSTGFCRRIYWILKVVFWIKIATFALLFINAAYQGLYYLFTRKGTTQVIRRFFGQNVTTFIVALAIFYILTKMGQGDALVESLLEKPGQYILPFILLLNFLAMMSWQWPYYHEQFRTLIPRDNPNSQNEDMIPRIDKMALLSLFKGEKMAGNSFSLWQAFFYVVYFKRGKAAKKEEKEFNQDIEWYDVQRLLSIILFVFAIYVFFDHWYKSGGFKFLYVFPVIAIVGITWGYFTLRARFKPLKIAIDTCGKCIELDDPEAGEEVAKRLQEAAKKNNNEEVIIKPRNFLIWFHRVIWLSILGMISSFSAYLWFYETVGWERVLSLIIFMFFNAVFYVPLTITRSYLRYFPRLSSLPKEKSSKFWSKTLSIFQPLLIKVWGKDQNFMSGLMIVALLSPLGVFFMNYNYEWNTWMHPINIAFVYVILLFSILNFFVKGTQVVFYPYDKKEEPEIFAKQDQVKKQYKIWMATLIVILGAFYYVSNNLVENHFHEQEQIAVLSRNTLTSTSKKSSDPNSHIRYGIPFEQYFQKRWELATADSTHWNKDPKDTSHVILNEPFYLIASDGGGLRAAYWTLMVLDQLDELSGERLYERTLAMSGASGGMIGLGMYMAIKNHQNNPIDRKNVIDKIGNANFFSNDLTFLLGKNIFKNFLPFNVSCMDDGSEKMALHYMKIAAGIAKGNSISAMNGSIAELDQPYRKVWFDNYIKSDSIYPLLLTNSTQTEESKKGIASPLRDEDSIFKAAISMLDFPIKEDSVSLSFADALFTCNRFPVLSQAAEIQNKGHFIDAGGFDNSGISSLLDLIDYMKSDHDSLYKKFRNNIVLISIHNDGATYITNHFEEFRDSLHQMNLIGEISPLINVGYGRSIAGEPALMDDLAKQLKKGKVLKDYLEIDLPFPVSRERIQNVYKGQLKTMPLNSIPCFERPCDPIQEKVDLLNAFTYGSYFREGEKDSLFEKLKNIYQKFSMKGDKVMPPHSPIVEEILSKGNSAYLVEPALGRILSTSSVDYMQKMLTHPEVEDKFEQLTGKK